MNPIERLPGWYVDTLPDGRGARVVRDSHIETHAGRRIEFPLPGENILQLVVSDLGGNLVIAGTGHHTDHAWLWVDGRWNDLDKCSGVNACAFDHIGKFLWVCRGGNIASSYSLRTMDRWDHPLVTGSQGIRFVDWQGVVHPCDESMEDPARGLWCYTDRGDCAIGQGSPDQIIVRFADDAIRRELDASHDTFCRWEWTDNDVAVSWVDERNGLSCWWTGTLDDLRTLPAMASPTPQPPPVEPEQPPAPPVVPPTAPPFTAGLDAIASQDGRFKLVMQNDGNPVVYGPNGSVYGLGKVWPWGGVPEPAPVPQNGLVGASYYTSITDPRCDPAEFAHRLRDLGCTHTRAWLIDAWAVGPNGPGQYTGFMPWVRDAAGVFDLDYVDQWYLDRLAGYVESMNESGITPTLTGWELYSWSDRKAGMLWVPDATKGPFQLNRQGIVYRNDFSFDQIATGGKHAFLGAFYAAVVTALSSLRYEVELGNEMPEKPLHERLRDLWRAAGYAGDIQVNRNEDAPGQFANMNIGRSYAKIAYHGRKDIGYLDELYPDEAPAGRPTTFREFYATAPDPARITLSSDGCRKSTNVEDAYDYDALALVARDALARGYKYEHQCACKLRSFRDGRFDLDDLAYDAPFLTAIQKG